VQSSRRFLGQIVQVKMDRPLGSKHPEQGFIYPVNYGFVPGVAAPDGGELDAYVLGVFEPIEEFTRRCIAIIHRTDDDDQRIVVPEGRKFTDSQIRVLTEFQEEWFELVIWLKRTPLARGLEANPQGRPSFCMACLVQASSPTNGGTLLSRPPASARRTATDRRTCVRGIFAMFTRRAFTTYSPIVRLSLLGLTIAKKARCESGAHDGNPATSGMHPGMFILASSQLFGSARRCEVRHDV